LVGEIILEELRLGIRIIINKNFWELRKNGTFLLKENFIGGTLT